MNSQKRLLDVAYRIFPIYSLSQILLHFGCDGRPEMFDALLDCQAGQSHTASMLKALDASPTDRNFVFSVEPTAVYIEPVFDDQVEKTLFVYADRSAYYYAADEDGHVWTDVEDFIDSRPELFRKGSEFIKVVCCLALLPDRFESAECLCDWDVRAAIMKGDILQFQVFNNRLLVMKHGEDRYRDAGAVYSEAFVEQVCCDICFDRDIQADLKNRAA